METFFTIMNIILGLAAIFMIYFGVTETRKFFKKDEEVKKGPLRVEVIQCSNQSAWYASIAKIKEEDKKSERIFEVESELTPDGYYRTIIDVAGNNVKGFIWPQDAKVI